MFSGVFEIDPGPVNRAVTFGTLPNIVRRGFFIQVALQAVGVNLVVYMDR